MDIAAQYGFKVIFPLIGDQTVMAQSTQDQFEQLLRNQIDEVGNHSALLMWNFSNELPLLGNPTLVATLNKYISCIMLKIHRGAYRFIYQELHNAKMGTYDSSYICSSRYSHIL